MQFRKSVSCAMMVSILLVGFPADALAGDGVPDSGTFISEPTPLTEAEMLEYESMQASAEARGSVNQVGGGSLADEALKEVGKQAVKEGIKQMGEGGAEGNPQKTEAGAALVVLGIIVIVVVAAVAAGSSA